MLAGRGRGPGQPVNPPVSLNATYEAGGDRVYGRDQNETWEAFEAAIGALEGGTAFAFASGLAAIAAVVDSLPAGAVVVAPADAYNGTRRLLADLERNGRLTARLVDITDTDAVAAAAPGADLIWAESPTNPMLGIADLSALAALGVPLAVDNTLASPLLQHPLELGAAVVVHSATKLIAGHSDVVMGVAVSRDDTWLGRLEARRSLHGAVPGPLETFLALRGLRTLPVRLDRASATAAELARRLEDDARISAVRYPGLPSHPQHALAAKQMPGGFGSMVAFEVAAGAEAAETVCESVRIAVHATSLGGVETLLERRGRYRGEQATPPNLIRLSCGLEHVEDLWADLDQALAAAATG